MNDTTVTPTVRSDEKWCTRCHQVKQRSEFGYHPNTADHKLNICSECMREAHRKPFRELEQRIQDGTFIPTGYGGKAFQKRAMQRLKEQQPQSVTVHVGHGVLPASSGRHMKPSASYSNAYLAAINAVDKPAAQPEAVMVAEPAVVTPAHMSLEAWLTEDNMRGAIEAFLVKDMLIIRSEDGYRLCSTDGDAPTIPVEPDILVYILRLKLGLQANQEITGVRYY